MDSNVANLIGVISSMVGIVTAVCATISYLQSKRRDPKVIIGAIITTFILVILLVKFSYNTPGIARVLPDPPPNPFIKKTESSSSNTPLSSATETPKPVTPSPTPPPTRSRSGTTFSAPSVFVRSTGEADIVTQGPDNSLWYYWAFPGSGWSSAQIAGNGTTTSAPSIFVRSTGEADIVAQGPDSSLWYYWAFPGKNWSRFSIS